MKEKLISFKTAKLAKEKGFDEGTNNGYGKDNEELHWTEYIIFHNRNNGMISASTQSLLQKWLRDEHDVYIQISEDFYGDGINHLVQVLIYDANESKNDYFSIKSSGQWGDNNEFKTYEDALEKGLQEALNRIELKK